MLRKFLSFEIFLLLKISAVVVLICTPILLLIAAGVWLIDDNGGTYFESWAFVAFTLWVALTVVKFRPIRLRLLQGEQAYRYNGGYNTQQNFFQPLILEGYPTHWVDTLYEYFCKKNNASQLAVLPKDWNVCYGIFASHVRRELMPKLIGAEAAKWFSKKLDSRIQWSTYSSNEYDGIYRIEGILAWARKIEQQHQKHLDRVQNRKKVPLPPVD